MITIYTGVSNDFGKTWQFTPAPVAGPPPQTGLAREEQNILFDKFGNLYLQFFMFSFDINTLEITGNTEWQLWNSINGGSTWNLLFRIPGPDNITITDEPAMAFGPDGQGGYALWYAWTNIQQPFVAPVVQGVFAGFIPVLGQNNFGTHIEFQPTNIPPGTASNVELAVGNNGQVFLALQQYRAQTVDFESPGYDSRMLLSLNPTGTVNYNATSFLPPQDIFLGNMGQDQVTDPTPISWQPSRGVFPQGFNFFAYDKKKGRLYAVASDRRPNFNIADYVSVFYIYTDNNGATWSDMHQINDVNFGSRGLASVSINQDTGALSVSFYDTRKHAPENVTTDFFASIFCPSRH